MKMLDKIKLVLSKCRHNIHQNTKPEDNNLTLSLKTSKEIYHVCFEDTDNWERNLRIAAEALIADCKENDQRK